MSKEMEDDQRTQIPFSVFTPTNVTKGPRPLPHVHPPPQKIDDHVREFCLEGLPKTVTQNAQVEDFQLILQGNDASCKILGDGK